MKKLYRLAIFYLTLGLGAGVVDREFSKFLNFNGSSSLALVHTHLLSLGFAGTLLLMLFRKLWPKEDPKERWADLSYHLGVIGLGVTLAFRGFLDMGQRALSSKADHALSGVAGLFHMLLALGLILYMWVLSRKLTEIDSQEKQ